MHSFLAAAFAGLVISTSLMGGGLASQPDAAVAEARIAVKRSLPFIEKVGTEWMENRNCNSCHVVTFQVWSHSAAAARGIDVDRTKLAEWTEWALADAKSDRYWFKLRPHVMDALKSDAVADAVLQKLKPLVGKSHVNEKLFLEAVEKALGAEDFTKYKDQLIKRATLPNNGGGPDTLAQLLLGRSFGPEEKTPTAAYDTVRKVLVEWQLPNGSWAADGQLPALKWDGAKEMDDATTLWSLLAVGAGDSPGEAAVQARARALAYLKTSRPGKTIQTLALHFIVASKFGEPAQAEALRQELLGRQNADGGWSWWKENKASDAFATGQALYALGCTGRDCGDPAVWKAWQFLISTQGSDGSWNVPQEVINTRPRKLNVYTFWGTAWATIGMLQTFPATEDSRSGRAGER